MIHLVTGGAGSGKSEYAEKLAGILFSKVQKSCGVHSGGRKIYLAAMHKDPADQESLRRIRRHRMLRAGKGFETIEKESEVDRIAVSKRDVVLIEDFSNLTANTIFADHKTAEYAAQSVLNLSTKAADIVVVTGEIACDILCYEKPVIEYIEAYTKAEAILSKEAETVTEVVCGIALPIKALRNEELL